MQTNKDDQEAVVVTEPVVYKINYRLHILYFGGELKVFRASNFTTEEQLEWAITTIEVLEKRIMSKTPYGVVPQFLLTDEEYAESYNSVVSLENVQGIYITVSEVPQ